MSDTYTYDPSGQRLSLSNGTTTTYYPSKFYNYDGTNRNKHIFGLSSEIATVTGTGASATVYSTATDQLTGTGIVTNTSDVQQELLDYMPFGTIRLDEKAGSYGDQRKDFGYEFDTDTGLNYANSRYYNPVTGQFISEDPIFLLAGSSNFTNRWDINWRDITPSQFTFYNQNINNQNKLALTEYLSKPQNLNSYSYVTNNPLRYTDPNGEFAFLAAAGELIGGASLSEFIVPAAIAAAVVTVGVVTYDYAKNQQMKWVPGPVPQVYNNTTADLDNLTPNGSPKSPWGKTIIAAAGAAGIITSIKEAYDELKKGVEYISNKINPDNSSKNSSNNDQNSSKSKSKDNNK